jgi:hypothetical protein
MIDVERQKIYISPIIHPNQERPAPVNPIPQPSEAKPDLARTLRESCVRFTEAADESFFFRQIYLLLAALFGKIEDMFLLWKAGTLPPPPIRQQTQTPQARTTPVASRPRHPSARRRPKRDSRIARPSRVRHAPRRRVWSLHTGCPPARDVPPRRIDRYPK